MNRSHVYTDYQRGTYFETSSNDPDYDWKKRHKMPLQNSYYQWYRQDGSGNSQFYDGRYWYGTSFGYSTFAAAAYYGYLNMPFGSDIKYFDTNHTFHVMLENQLASNIKGEMVNTLTALGEYSQTASTYKSSVDAYRSLLGHVVAGGSTQSLKNKKSNFAGHSYELARKYIYERHKIRGGRLMKIAKAAADAWLVVSYGLRPLYNDVVGAAEALAKSNGDVEKVIIETFKSKVGPRPLTAELSYDNGGTLSQQCGMSGTMKGNAKVAVVTVNPLLKLAQELGITNPIYATWNLIPFSFVVDWFVNIGEYLKGIIPPVGIEFLSGYTYVKAQGYYYLDTQLKHSLPYAYLSYQDGSSFKERRLLSVMPMPEIIVPDLSLTKAQITSAVALVLQMLPFVRK